MAQSVLARPRLSSPNIILGLVSAAHAVNHAFSILMQVQIYPLILDEFRLTNGDIGLMVGVGTAVSGFLQFAFSYLSRYVARRILIGVGQVVMGVSTALAGLTPGYPLFFFWNTLARLAGSPQHPVGNSIISDRFEQKARGLALSMHVTGGNVGTVAAQILGAVVVTALGWRMTLYLFAALALLMGLAVIFLVDDHKSAELKAYEADAHQRPLWSHLAEIMRERNIFFIMIASTIAAGGRGLGVLTTYVPLYFTSVHLDKFTFDLLNSLMLIGAVVGPAILGRVSDSVGRKRTLFWTYGAATVISLIFISLSPSSLAQIAVIFLLGTTYSESPLLQAYLADSTMNVDRDLAFGLYFTITFGIGSVWTTLLGYFIDAFGFQWGFYVMAATYIGAARASSQAKVNNRQKAESDKQGRAPEMLGLSSFYGQEGEEDWCNKKRAVGPADENVQGLGVGVRVGVLGVAFAAGVGVGVTSTLKYASTIFLKIGAATADPSPACSAITATAISGLSAGA